MSLALLFAVRIAPLPTGGAEAVRGTAWRELADGLRHIRRHRVLAPLTLVVALGELGFVGPLTIGLTLLARQRGWGAAGMGWIVAAFGAGAAAASLLIAVRGRVGRAGLVQCLALLAGAVPAGALAFVPDVALAAVAGVLAGLLAGLGGTLGAALVQSHTVPAYLGRVTSVQTFFALGLAPLRCPAVGTAIGAWGTRPVFVVGAGVCAAGALVGLCCPDLRRVELPR
ncbi:hypothetical protein GCM10010446_53440 [Streptomyces enissocaesilis]|uniref:MFS transporter n=1 Tax=Streptomyces enissocaesilis TaxID=332589 RepID=A0ABN3XLL8_9ACTN